MGTKKLEAFPDYHRRNFLKTHFQGFISIDFFWFKLRGSFYSIKKIKVSLTLIYRYIPIFIISLNILIHTIG